MQIGVVFPTTQVEPDAGAIRAFATGVEELGFAHVVAFDHVVGVDPDIHRRLGRDGTFARFRRPVRRHERLP